MIMIVQKLISGEYQNALLNHEKRAEEAESQVVMLKGLLIGRAA